MHGHSSGVKSATGERSARGIAAVAVLTCSLQSILLARFALRELPFAIGAVLSLALAVLAIQEFRQRPNHRIGRSAALVFAALGVLLMTVDSKGVLDWPIPFPQVMIAWYVASFIAIALSLLVRTSGPPMVAIFIVATGLGWGLANINLGFMYYVPDRMLSGTFERDDELTYRYGPHVVFRGYYPDDPRGYFTKEPSEQKWQRDWYLNTYDDARAELLVPGEPDGPLRVVIDEVVPNEAWKVLLTRRAVDIRRSQSVRLSIRMRASDAMTCFLSLVDEADTSQPIKPPRNLYVTPEWTVTEFFETIPEPGRVMVQLSLGERPGFVELGDFEMQTDEGAPIDPESIGISSYCIEYRMNSMGFRTPEVQMPKPERTYRIVLLGDSFAMGQGVHIEDNLANQLEAQLNQQGEGHLGRHYEVVNLARCMYSTREERIVFERAVDKIDPDLVILVICGNDALPVGDPETMKQLPIPDLDGCLNEVQQLVDDCRERNISFAFTLYRIEPASMFIRTMMRRFEEYATKNKIPYVELGSILLSKFRTSQLVVHRTDPHPNEIAHRLAAEALAELVIENELLQRHE